MAKEAYSGRYDMFEHDKRDAAEAKKKKAKYATVNPPIEKGPHKRKPSRKAPTERPLNWKTRAYFEREGPQMAPDRKKPIIRKKPGEHSGPPSMHKSPGKWGGEGKKGGKFHGSGYEIDTEELKKRVRKGAKGAKGAAKKGAKVASKAAGWTKGKLKAAWDKTKELERKSRVEKKKKPSRYKPAPRN